MVLQGWYSEYYKMQSYCLCSYPQNGASTSSYTIYGNTLPRPHAAGGGAREKKMAGIADEALPLVTIVNHQYCRPIFLYYSAYFPATVMAQDYFEGQPSKFHSTMKMASFSRHARARTNCSLQH